MRKIILASQSPRRKELLALAGYDFQVITSDVEEIITKVKSAEIAEDLSSQKAEDVYNKVIETYGTEQGKEYIVIGADTIVSVDGDILGKPKDKDDAHRMISLLQGRAHQVYTGVTLVYMGSEGKKAFTFSECTDVICYPMTEDEICSYVNHNILSNHKFEDDVPNKSTGILYDWADKAGGYGIQGTFAKYISGIKGDYYNVMGLPIARLHQELKKID